MAETREAYGYCVYIINASISRPEWFKIGIAGEGIYDRIRTLNQGNPLRELRCPVFAFCPDKNNRDLETILHDRFKQSYACNNEWFMSIRFKEAVRLFKDTSYEFGAELIQIDETLSFSKGRIEQYLPKTLKEIDRLRNYNNGKT